MYKKTSASGNSRRPRFRGSRPAGKSGVRPHGRNFNSKNRSFGKTAVNISAFINKAVTVTEKSEPFVPEHSFGDFALETSLKRSIASRGYLHPTPVQDKVIPHILHGKDVVGLSNTGTGKTAAFLIPLINKILSNRNEQVLVLTPTRELALQIEQEFVSFAKNLGLGSVVCVGGASIGAQISRLRRRNHFIIGTPGRMMDLMKRNVLKIDAVRTIVLDEADRMLDMGFIGSMRFIMEKMPKERHTLFFSATMSANIKALIKDFLKDPVTVSVIMQDAAENIEQDVVKLKGRNKIDVLHDFLIQAEFKKVLIFGRTKHGIDKLWKLITARGIKVEAIHGNKSQSQRQRALQSFKENRVQVLVATDVAARGLDIDCVTHVINYELPDTYEDYIHRIGRTGRGTKKGKALTFVE